jgi:hypothetical protein
MTTLLCGYPGDRDGALVTYLYDDGGADSGERALFDAHVKSCARCRDDLDALRGVRTQLARWAPPEPRFVVANPQSRIPNPWWPQVPAWAQVAAALLFLGVSAGIANLDVRYDQNGLSVRTGWRPPARDTRLGGQAPLNVGQGATGVAQGSPMTQGSAVAPGLVSSTSAPWRADLAALERQLKTELRSAQTSAAAASQPQMARTIGDADVIRRVRALLDESEKRQQSELALRVAEVMRDVNAQRQADLVKIDRTLGTVQNNLGVEVLKNRQQLNQMNLLYRASQRQ